MLVREAAEYLDRVVADSEERDAVGLQVGKYLLQLNQLRLAEGSPLGASVEDHEGLAARTGRMQVYRASALVGQPDVRKTLTLPRTDLVEVPRPKLNQVSPHGWTTSDRRP